MSRNLIITILIGFIFAFFAGIVGTEISMASSQYTQENHYDDNLDVPFLTEDRYTVEHHTLVYTPNNTPDAPIVPTELPGTSGECEMQDCYNSTFDYLSALSDYR